MLMQMTVATIVIIHMTLAGVLFVAFGSVCHSWQDRSATGHD